MFDALFIPPKPAIIVPRPRGIVRADGPRIVVPPVVCGGMIINAYRYGAAAATAALASSDSSASNTTNYPFTDKNTGTAAADRIMVTVVVWRGESAQRSLNTFTIGGVGGTQRVTTGTGGPSNTRAEIWIHALTTGTSATYDFTFSGNLERMGWASYETHGLLSSTPTDTALHTSSGPAALNIDCEAGGVIIAGGYYESATAPTWSNLPDTTPPAWKAAIDGANDRGTASAQAFAAAQTNLAVSCAIGSPTPVAFAAGAFR